MTNSMQNGTVMPVPAGAQGSAAVKEQRYRRQHRCNVEDLVAIYSEDHRREVEAVYEEVRQRHEAVSRIWDFIPIIAFRETKEILAERGIT